MAAISGDRHGQQRCNECEQRRQQAKKSGTRDKHRVLHHLLLLHAFDFCVSPFFRAEFSNSMVASVAEEKRARATARCTVDSRMLQWDLHPSPRHNRFPSLPSPSLSPLLLPLSNRCSCFFSAMKRTALSFLFFCFWVHCSPAPDHVFVHLEKCKVVASRRGCPPAI
jgi:hypothetical protein